MKTLYIDCSMGAAGDMLTAAISELLPNKNEYLKKLNSLNIPNVEYSFEDCIKCAVKGTKAIVKVNGVNETADISYHSHGNAHSLSDIEGIINNINASDKVKNDALSIYKIIAEAESRVHNISVSQIHLHELGMYDAIADIAAFCVGVEELGVEKIVASSVNLGSGTVKCAHGILPVPAPATVNILEGVPCYMSESIAGELCTPTGAALLKYFVNEFSAMPEMIISGNGYGMGTKDFDRANCVRMILGNSKNNSEKLFELSCNIDDMTAEEIAYATEVLQQSSALEVYSIPVKMKKNRMGTLINVVCREEDKQDVIRLIFKHTSTLGIREKLVGRHKLDRRLEKIQTKYGPVSVKISSGYGTEKSKLEYEDLKRIAQENNLSIAQVKKEIGNI